MSGRRIALIGMMGCGKTTLGKRLAQSLGRPFIDLDALIEQRESASIDALFLRGEAAFRGAEARALREACTKPGVVIACGGGVVLREENRRLLSEHCTIVFIDRPLWQIARDIDSDSRPLLRDDPNALAALHAQRRALYEGVADIHLLNDGDIDGALQKLMRALEEQEGST